MRTGLNSYRVLFLLFNQIRTKRRGLSVTVMFNDRIHDGKTQ